MLKCGMQNMSIDAICALMHECGSALAMFHTTCGGGVAGTSCRLVTTMTHVVTLPVALVASDRLADVTLTRTLQNCLSDVSSHDCLGLSTHLRVAASHKTFISDHKPSNMSGALEHVFVLLKWLCICNSNAMGGTKQVMFSTTRFYGTDLYVPEAAEGLED